MSRDNLHCDLKDEYWKATPSPDCEPTVQTTGRRSSHNCLVAGRALSQDSPGLPSTSSSIKLCVAGQRVRMGNIAKMMVKTSTEILSKTEN